MKKQLAIALIPAIFGVTLTACGSSGKSSAGDTLSVGSMGPGGGVIFAFLDDENTTGLEVFTSVIGAKAWGCSGVDVDDANATRSTSGVNVPSGAESSELLRTANSSGTCLAEAAQLAFEFSNNGFNDWYLPSTEELMTIRDLGLLPGEPADAYWSATEDSAQNAFLVHIRVPTNPIDNGLAATSSKEVIADVVPIRSF